MKIVLLDTVTVSDGDVSFAPITKLGDVTAHQYVPPAQVAAAIGDADAVVCNKTVITADIMDACPNLKFIGLFATGYNTIDVAAAKQRGIVVCNAPNYSTDAVAQHAFTLMLALVGNLVAYDASVRRGDWTKCPQFTYFPFPVMELAGKTLGIFGFGAIGQKVADIARAFGMRVIVCTRSPQKCPDEIHVPFETLLRESDIVSLHCPLTEETAHLINRNTLQLMKSTAILINTARGGVMDSAAVAAALRNGTIAACGTDVLEVEPMRADDPLRDIPNCLITPHIAWAPQQTRERLVDMVAENITAFQNGVPIHVVNP